MLNRNTLKGDPKNAVDATLEFLRTVVTGHFLACACQLLGITRLSSPVCLPPGLYQSSPDQQRVYVTHLASQVVEQCTLVEHAYSDVEVSDAGDHVHNYARILCHLGALVLEFTDGWAEGDGERVYRCWRLLLPHFKAANHTKYALEALRLQFNVKAVLSPQLAHQVLWDRFVNTRGGMGHNIPCDLYNEHVNKLLKHIIASMGANLTAGSLQRAACSVSTLQAICKQFDRESDVAVGTVAHSTRADAEDVAKVTNTVLKLQLLQVTPGRAHLAFRKMRLDPLWNWRKEETKQWIEQKMKEFMKFNGALKGEGDESDSEATD